MNQIDETWIGWEVQVQGVPMDNSICPHRATRNLVLLGIQRNDISPEFDTASFEIEINGFKQMLISMLSCVSPIEDDQ